MTRMIALLLMAGVLLMSSGCGLPHWEAREEVAAGVRVPIVYNKGYNVDIFGFERGTMFDAHRYEKIYRGLKAAGLVDRDTVVVPNKITDEELRTVHTAKWVKQVHDRRTVAAVFETPMIARLPSGLVEDRIVGPFRYQTKGTVLAARYALTHGVAATLGGGFAHAKADNGEGFNLFADVPLAVALLRQQGWEGKVFVLDVDAHHGQGNAALLARDKRVYVMDVYNRDIYPGRFEWVDRAIKLDGGTDDKGYLKQLRKRLPKALRRFRPDLMIYVAGVDCCEKDRLGELAVSEAGIEARDRFVIDQCAQRGIPLCMTLSGGYWDGAHRPSVAMIKYATERLTR